MPCYENVTDATDIQRQIDRNIQDKEKAEDVVQLVANLCWETDITPDPMSQWINLLNQHVRAAKWGGSADLIEIYPSGTKGIGKSDRMKLQVGRTQVKLVEAYESEH